MPAPHPNMDMDIEAAPQSAPALEASLQSTLAPGLLQLARDAGCAEPEGPRPRPLQPVR